jgi:hypothetical protein
LRAALLLGEGFALTVAPIKHKLKHLFSRGLKFLAVRLPEKLDMYRGGKIAVCISFHNFIESGVVASLDCCN